ncbi:hypothetical protein J7K43_05700 [Candidatus Calescamantes bacterium]|nr:hypothetical protein [Candidatus Calescamantes bacterium]
MIRLFILLGFILLIHLIQKLAHKVSTQDEYVATQEEVEAFLRETSSPQEEVLAPQPEIPPPSQPKEEPIHKEKETVAPVQEEIPSYLPEEKIARKPGIFFDRDSLRKAFLYQAILAPPRAEKEWEWEDTRLG